MKVAHWTMKNGSGMHRMAEEISAQETKMGLDSLCLDGADPKESADGFNADIHVVHTHLPDGLADRRIKKVFVAHGTPESNFRSAINAMSIGVHGFSDPFMASLYMIRSSDAVVTFWPRHKEIWKSMMDKRSVVHCIPMGIDKTKWSPGDSRGKYAGSPSLLTAENCHEIKWPLDLFIAMSWVFDAVPEARLHVIYLPLDQCRWWGALTFNNGTAYRSFISSVAFSKEDLANAFRSVDYYVGLVRYGDYNRICLEAKASGCRVISYRGNPYADYWLDEGDQRMIAAQMTLILQGAVSPRECPEVPDISETASAMMKIYEGIA